jgi:hypothetical protein
VKIGEGWKGGKSVAVADEIVEDAAEEFVVRDELGNVLLQNEKSGASQEVVDVFAVRIFRDPIWIVRSKRRSRGSRLVAD